MNKLYFGDNLDMLRQHVKDESVDLVYLDPPFNSNAVYNLLFEEQGGLPSQAQAEAFRDTWGWGESAAVAFDDVMRSGGDIAVLLRAVRTWLGDAGMTAYLAMMAVRLLELRRVLKPTGSIYLHCDPTASHYIKLMLDGIFGHENFRNEIIWKRSSAHNRAKRWGPVHDVLLFYSASDKYTWNRTFANYDERYLEGKYRHRDEQGRVYRLSDLTGPGTRTGDSGEPWRGVNPTEYGRHWEPPHDRALPHWFKRPEGWSELSVRQRIELMQQGGLIRWPNKKGGRPEFRRYRETALGQPIQDVITDIDPINSMAKERLGYPTQKPVTLLERLISASTNTGEVVFDPFCGCGTSVEAAERLGRQWIGVDVTHYAITLIEKRLKQYSAEYGVEGRPADLEGARELARRDKYQFQWWAAWVLGAQTYEGKKGADRGVDANIYFANGPFGHGRIIISVKGGDNVSPAMVRELAGVVEREKAEMGVLITLQEPTRAMKSDAIGQGFVAKSAHGRLPRVQIATIADLLDKKWPTLPPLPKPLAAGPRSKAAKDRDQLEFLFPFKTTSIVTEDGVFIDPQFVVTG